MIKVERPDDKRLEEPGIMSWSVWEKEVSEFSVGDHLEKGQEMGHFAYGGSSILLVFEPGAIQFIPGVTEESQPVQARSRIGISTPL